MGHVLAGAAGGRTTDPAEASPARTPARRLVGCVPPDVTSLNIYTAAPSARPARGTRPAAAEARP